MNDNDLIRRGDALEAIDKNIMWGAPRLAIKQIPAVEQPMNAVEYLTAHKRMHDQVRLCAECPLSHYNNGRGSACRDFEDDYPDEAVAIVEQWAREHPERRENDGID